MLSSGLRGKRKIGSTTLYMGSGQGRVLAHEWLSLVHLYIDVRMEMFLLYTIYSI